MFLVKPNPMCETHCHSMRGRGMPFTLPCQVFGLLMRLRSAVSEILQLRRHIWMVSCSFWTPRKLLRQFQGLQKCIWNGGLLRGTWSCKYTPCTPLTLSYDRILNRNIIRASSGPSNLLSAVIDAYISSIPDHNEDSKPGLPPNLKSSWSCIAVGLYLTSVLGVWNRGLPPENRHLYRNLLTLRRDLDESLSDIMGQDASSWQFWFWKAFLGAFCLAHVGFVVEEGVVSYTRLLDLVPLFNRHLQTSARRMRFKRWQYAR